jgi:hypothetical protein
MVTAFVAPKKPRYWGGDAATQGMYDQLYQQEYDRARRQYELEYFDQYGYFPGQQESVRQAQEAAQAEYDQLISEIQGAIGRLDEDPIAAALREQLMGQAYGSNVPYDAETLNALISGATSPIMRGAQSGLHQLRESMASRGLGRSGGLGSLEQQLMQEAILNSTRAAADTRARGQLANYESRQAGLQGLHQFNLGQTQQRNALMVELARLRSQKSFDPSYFRGGRTAGPASGAGFDYAPPPDVERSLTGRSAPKYPQFQSSAWDITAGKRRF